VENYSLRKRIGVEDSGLVDEEPLRQRIEADSAKKALADKEHAITILAPATTAASNTNFVTQHPEVTRP